MPDRDISVMAAIAAGDDLTAAAIYSAAAKRCEVDGATDAACFLLTHAYVHALVGGDEQMAASLHARLVGYGRET